MRRHFQQNFEFKKVCYKDSQGSSRFSEKVQYKAVYHRLTASEINAGKVKLCKFRNLRHVKFSPPVDATATCESSLHKHSKEDANLLAVIVSDCLLVK